MSKFANALKGEIQKVKIGDPFDSTTDMGPLVSEAQRGKVEGYIRKGVQEGGRIVQGGSRPTIPGHESGYYIEPTVIETDNENSSIVKEEIFGPVYTVMRFSDYDDAIQRSNDVVYGLGASVWTKDITTAMRAVRDLRFGTVWVNDHIPVPSEMPWAGYKQSGHGASLSQYSLEEFTYIKHVYFDITGVAEKNWQYAVHGIKP
jgi:betaine-aldehyde dehydrogenase